MAENMNTAEPENAITDHEVDNLYHEDAESECGSECSSEVSEVSETSTLEFDHEPYSTFQEKVKQLIISFDPKLRVDQVEVERMRGGSYNRVIGANVRRYAEKKNSGIFMKVMSKLMASCMGRSKQVEQDIIEELIVRIPRDRSDGMEYQIATLEFVASRICYPVPKVLVHCTSEMNNPLGTAYMVQQRLPGESLAQLWPTLTIGQKQNAARQISKILLDLSSITHEAPGIVSRTNPRMDLKGTVKLETFAVPSIGTYKPEGNVPYTFPSEPQTTADFLKGLCERWREYELASWGKTVNVVWNGFINIIDKMHNLGYLPDEDKFHFCHQDLETRNLLAIVRGDSIEITGILDWDLAAFAPKFVAYRAPFSLWKAEEMEDYEEAAVLTMSDNPEDATLKQAYEDIVGDNVLRYAYCPEYIIARRMFYVLQHGLHSSWEITGAKEIIADFEKLNL